VEKLSWSDMKMIFAIQFASEIAAVAEDGGESLLRERVAALDDDQRQLLPPPSVLPLRRRAVAVAAMIPRRRPAEDAGADEGPRFRRRRSRRSLSRARCPSSFIRRRAGRVLQISH
jgi:hypothetical protein